MSNSNKGKKKDKKFNDPIVIEDKLLIQAVKDYYQENKIIQPGPIKLANILELSLSFKSIYSLKEIIKIQYLDCLDKLQKLQLDNNLIEKVQNLDHLVNLKWLGKKSFIDLSFNCIKEIQGLTKLVNLTDLSLFNNQIRKLQGLQSCSKLNVFSVGNNKLQKSEQVIEYFGKGQQKSKQCQLETKFRYLQSLTVSGNPFTVKQGEQYQFSLIAFLPNLKYLNYFYIDEIKRNKIRDLDDKYKTQDQYTFMRNLRQEEKDQLEYFQQKRKKQIAKMDIIDNFHEELLLNQQKTADQQIQKVKKIRGVDQEMAKFTLKIKQIIEGIQKNIKQKNQQKLIQIRVIFINRNSSCLPTIGRTKESSKPLIFLEIFSILKNWLLEVIKKSICIPTGGNKQTPQTAIQRILRTRCLLSKLNLFKILNAK